MDLLSSCPPIDGASNTNETSISYITAFVELLFKRHGTVILPPNNQPSPAPSPAQNPSLTQTISLHTSIPKLLSSSFATILYDPLE